MTHLVLRYGNRVRAGQAAAAVAVLGLACGGCSAQDGSAVPTDPASGEKVGGSAGALAGIDGSLTVTAPNTILNRYTALSANARAGATSLRPLSVAALGGAGDALGPGDLLLVAQMQGATIDTASLSSTWGQVTSLGGAGSYELVEVLAVNAATNTVTLSCALRNSYDISGATQVVRVPQYTTLTIAAGASVTAPAWNGTTGGVVAIHAQTTVTLNGNIDVSARGFRGGATDNSSSTGTADVASYASTSPTDGARKGESIAGLRTDFGRGAPANGGGGGNAHNTAGGGGANARSPGIWTGLGVFDLSVTGGATAWLLDPRYSATSSPGGGRGGYSYSELDLNALLVGPGNPLWSGQFRRERGGLGGRPLDNDPGSRLFFGGGGGAGDGNNGHAGRGGNGGGIVLLLAGSVTGTGSILANGEDGVDADSTSGGSLSGDGPGGGGGGGSVVVRASSARGFRIAAVGGAGGDQRINFGAEAQGPGGGAGGGYVAVSAAVGPAGPAAIDVSGGRGGTTSSPALVEFPANGATRGAAGLLETGAAVVGDIPLCVDATAPDTTIATRPTDPTSDTTGDFTFTSNDPNATFECRLDGAATFTRCGPAYVTPALSDGSHTISVRARDAVGNIDSTPAIHTWTVDTVAPETTIATYPTDPSDDATPEFSFTANEGGVSFECRLDAAAIFTPCPALYSVEPPLADGSHTLQVRARDAAGNVDATPAEYTWRIEDAVIPDGGTDPDGGADAGSDAGTGGSGGTDGGTDAGTAGSSGSGGADGGIPDAGEPDGGELDGDTRVLGGGICSYRTPHAQGHAFGALFAVLAVWLGRRRLRAGRPG